MPEIKNVQDNVFEQLCIEAKYSGYMKRQSSDIETFKKDEAVKIKSDIDYRKIGGLSREVVAKLEKVRPSTIGEASRISGVTPAAVIAILGYMKNKGKNMKEKNLMLSGKLYKAADDELKQDFLYAKKITRQINLTAEDESEKRQLLFKQLFKSTGNNFYIEPPFHCDYGKIFQ